MWQHIQKVVLQRIGECRRLALALLQLTPKGLPFGVAECCRHLFHAHFCMFRTSGHQASGYLNGHLAAMYRSLRPCFILEFSKLSPLVFLLTRAMRYSFSYANLSSLNIIDAVPGI